MRLLTSAAKKEVVAMHAAPPLTPDSMTLVLAYAHDYTPNFLPGRCLPPTHLRALAAWLGTPLPRLRSARANPRLAVHLALGHAAGLLRTAEGFWRTTPETQPWLEAAWPEQLEALLAALGDAARWAEALATLSLEETLGVDYLAYLAQQLARLRDGPAPETGTAVWLSGREPAAWGLALPARLPPPVWFTLLQMGAWAPDAPRLWRATPYTIARAALAGCSLTRMERTLARATGAPLPETQQNQLVEWYQGRDAARIRPVYLLSVKDPALLDDALAQQRWRAHLGRRLSRRHAIVAPGIIPLLRRRLRAAGLALDAPPARRSGALAPATVAAGDCWLALEALAGVARLIPLPFTLPAETRWRLAQQLDPAQQAALALKAEQIVDGVAAALRGRDAYFPPAQPPDPRVAAAIRGGAGGRGRAGDFVPGVGRDGAARAAGGAALAGGAAVGDLPARLLLPGGG
jgi:hypothetical protein